MEKLEVKYKYVDASSGACSYILLIAFVAIVAFCIPYLWLIVAFAVLFVLPIQYFEDKKQQKRFNENVPALVIDGNLLYYKGKTIDLAQMEKARFHPDIDYDGNIQIYRKGKRAPDIEIYTDNMLIDRNELLRIIIDRIDRVEKTEHIRSESILMKLQYQGQE